MRFITALAMAAALPILTASASFAMSGHENTMKMAKCSSGDAAVIFNTTKKTYVLDNKKNRIAMAGMMSHDKFICKSQAEKMGGKPAMHKPESMMHR